MMYLYCNICQVIQQCIICYKKLQRKTTLRILLIAFLKQQCIVHAVFIKLDLLGMGFNIHLLEFCASL